MSRQEVQHALGCVVRVIRCLLGASSIADRKVEHGAELVILGLLVSASDDRISARAAPGAGRIPRGAGGAARF